MILRPALLKAQKRRQEHVLLMYRQLWQYLADIDNHAQQMFDTLFEQMKEQEAVTEELKGENQMLWMHQMNNIHNRVMEIINTDLIYV